jgi:hypothetical protein
MWLVRRRTTSRMARPWRAALRPFTTPVAHAAGERRGSSSTSKARLAGRYGKPWLSCLPASLDSWGILEVPHDARARLAGLF